jgi:hypothetical protein
MKRILAKQTNSVNLEGLVHALAISYKNFCVLCGFVFTAALASSNICLQMLLQTCGRENLIGIS